MTQSDRSSSELISRKKLAAMMDVSIETIKRKERRGELHPLKFNARLVRYRVKDVAQWFLDSSATKIPALSPYNEPFFKRSKAHEEALLKKAATKKNN